MPTSGLGNKTSRGFTLLELMVVVAIIAIASAGVAWAVRDSSQTVLDREAERLSALLETARALSRTSGQVMRWRDTGAGFRFEGLNAAQLPQNWLSTETTVRWEPGSNAQRTLLLGPEPIIEPQAVHQRRGQPHRRGQPRRAHQQRRQIGRAHV